MAEIDTDGRTSYVEVSATLKVVKTSAPKSSLTNFGPDTAYFRDRIDSTDLARDDAERVGEVPIQPSDTLPLSDGISKFNLQCKPGQTAKLWYVPLRS